MEKSTHQLFKDYLLSEESLSPEQSRLMQEHLRECAECRQQEAAWMDIHRLFRSAEVVAPAAGFISRWQERLAAQRLKSQRKRAWIFFGVTAAIAVILSGLLIFGSLQVIDSPLQVMGKAVYFLVITFSYYRQVTQFVDHLSLVVPVLSFIGVILFTGFVSFVSVLWAVVYRKLSSSWRVML